MTISNQERASFARSLHQAAKRKQQLAGATVVRAATTNASILTGQPVLNAANNTFRSELHMRLSADNGKTRFLPLQRAENQQASTSAKNKSSFFLLEGEKVKALSVKELTQAHAVLDAKKMAEKRAICQIQRFKAENQCDSGIAPSADTKKALSRLELKLHKAAEAKKRTEAFVKTLEAELKSQVAAKIEPKENLKDDRILDQTEDQRLQLLADLQARSRELDILHRQNRLSYLAHRQGIDANKEQALAEQKPSLLGFDQQAASSALQSAKGNLSQEELALLKTQLKQKRYELIDRKSTAKLLFEMAQNQQSKQTKNQVQARINQIEARVLECDIAQLEAKIQKLESQQKTTSLTTKPSFSGKDSESGFILAKASYRPAQSNENSEKDAKPKSDKAKLKFSARQDLKKQQ